MGNWRPRESPSREWTRRSASPARRSGCSESRWLTRSAGWASRWRRAPTWPRRATAPGARPGGSRLCRDGSATPAFSWTGWTGWNGRLPSRSLGRGFPAGPLHHLLARVDGHLDAPVLLPPALVVVAGHRLPLASTHGIDGPGDAP